MASQNANTDIRLALCELLKWGPDEEAATVFLAALLPDVREASRRSLWEGMTSLSEDIQTMLSGHVPSGWYYDLGDRTVAMELDEALETAERDLEELVSGFLGLAPRTNVTSAA